MFVLRGTKGCMFFLTKGTIKSPSPTLSQWGVIIFSLLVLCLASVD